jgi:hypothetical protein
MIAGDCHALDTLLQGLFILVLGCGAVQCSPYRWLSPWGQRTSAQGPPSPRDPFASGETLAISLDTYTATFGTLYMITKHSGRIAQKLVAMQVTCIRQKSDTLFE